MKENGHKDADFFWLGRVPCRSVHIVGMVVGIQVFEKRVVYSIDDGTSVIDCVHRPESVPPSPHKHHNTTKSKYERPKTPPPPVDLVPVAYVGTSVGVVGRVTRWHNSRQLKVDVIEPCKSFTDEPFHWRTVQRLHAASYSLPGPFVIPSPVAPPSTPTPSSSIPNHNSGAAETQSQRPKHVVQIDEAPPSSPISSTFSSPTRPTPHSQSPQKPKLRHPSRLHTRDLTANTFRIYLKHYMDNAPLVPAAVEVRLGTEMETSRAPSTPTKSKSKPYQFAEMTPRPTISRVAALEQTPRPPTPMSSFRGDFVNTITNTSHSVTQAQAQQNFPESQTLGFTLSHLRRVSELSALSRRVVKAEAKRRARELRKLQQQQQQQLPLTSRGTKNVAGPSPRVNLETEQQKEMIAPKMKRLFQWAIVKLHEEGSIVLWDGPVRPLPVSHSLHLPGNWSGMGTLSTSELWQTSTASAATGDGTLFSVGTATAGIIEDEDEDELSDPPPPGAGGEGEEAYIPLTPTHLAPHVVRAIRAFTSPSPATTTPASSSSHKPPRPHRTRPAPAPTPLPGPTVQEITTFLHRTDGRWARVGEWAVCDALEVLKSSGTVWCVGGGRWEICL